LRCLRTVHGATASPAGIDPTQILPSQPGSYVTGLPRIKVKAETYPPESKEAAEVLEIEKAIGAAIVRGDAAYFDSATSSDFVMVHGDGWTRGGTPTLVDDKNSFMKRIAGHSYAAHDFDSVKVEMHGDVAITYGRYVGNIPSSGEGRAWFAVWYEKIYAHLAGECAESGFRCDLAESPGIDVQVWISQIRMVEQVGRVDTDGQIPGLSEADFLDQICIHVPRSGSVDRPEAQSSQLPRLRIL